MITLTQSQVIFNEAEHTYTLNGKPLQGITAIVAKHLGIEMPDTPIVRAAAERGSEIHQYIQASDTLDLTAPEDTYYHLAQAYSQMKQQAQATTIANEYNVTDNLHFASNIDVVWADSEDRIILGDIKTTSQLNREYLSWQLSIYAYLFEQQNPQLKVHQLVGLWLHPEKPTEMVVIPRKQDTEVIALLQAAINKDTYTPQTLNDLDTEINQLALLMRQSSELNTIIEQHKKHIMEKMQADNMLKLDHPECKIAYTPERTSNRFDTTLFKKEQAELYQQYQVSSTTKPSLRVTLK